MPVQNQKKHISKKNEKKNKKHTSIKKKKENKRLNKIHVSKKVSKENKKSTYLKKPKEDKKLNKRHVSKKSKKVLKVQKINKKHISKKNKKIKKQTPLIWAWIFAITLLILVSLLYITHKDNNLNQDFNSEVNIDFFVRSLGAIDQQSENLLFSKINAFGNQTELHVNYIGDPSSISSVNGDSEIKEDILQICFQYYYPNLISKFILCRNKDFTKDWKKCTAIETSKIEKCINSNEGKELLKSSFRYSEKKEISVSPTILLNNQRIFYYPGTDYFKRSICKIINTSKICSELPEEDIVNLFIVSDKRCKNCNTLNSVSKLNQIFPGLTVKEYDINEKEGKEIYKKTNSIYLPLFAFDKSVLTADGYRQIWRYLEKRGEYYILKLGSKFNPNKEICDNKIDDTGNKLIDCLDPDCKDSLVCRKNIPNKLDLYIMSDCPYGREAVKVAKPILDNFGNKIDFSIHYIAHEQADETFTSLHGSYEAQEDMKQLCIIKHYPKSWFNYILCRSQKGIKNNDWKKCANNNSINIKVIEKCINGSEGKSLLSQDIKITQSLGISSSPTWMANNRHKFSGLNPESVKNQFCNYNLNLKGCENHLNSNSNTLPNSCS